MGHIRTLKPEFFRSRSLARCSIAATLTFQGLWSEADDSGCGIANALLIKGAIWPLRAEVTAEDVEQHLQELAATGHIRLYEVDDERYYQVTSWEKHQSASFRRGAARFPSPPAETDTLLHTEACREVQDDARCTPKRAGTGNREQGTGNREQGTCASVG